jgi:malate dehydrogenase (oxaloacetate-decarboxylating)(NADP+)
MGNGQTVIRKEDASRCHSSDRKGESEVVSTEPWLTQRDLSLACAPGVAEPCLTIAAQPDLAYEYVVNATVLAVAEAGQSEQSSGRSA